MRNILLIARRDLSAYLHGVAGYAIIAAVLFIDGVLFNAYALGDGAHLSSEVLSNFFYLASGTTMIAGILLAMPTFAEERTRGTDVLLTTSPVRDAEVVGGKYLAALGMLTLLIALTGYMPMMILWNGKIALAHVLVGYAGLFCLGAATTAIGVLGSALVNNQFAAGILSAVMVVTLLICWKLASVVDAPLTDVIAYMSLFDKHFVPFLEGRLLLSGVVYYASLVGVFLWLTTRVLEGRKLA